jgi:hypothetical protein
MAERSKVINLSHIKNEGRGTGMKPTQFMDPDSQIVDLKVNTPPDDSARTNMINLNVKSELTLAQGDEGDMSDKGDSGGHEENGAEDGPGTNSRLRPNSSFLRRFVGGVEKSNEKLPIVSPALDVSVESIDKAGVIEELKGSSKRALSSHR